METTAATLRRQHQTPELGTHTGGVTGPGYRLMHREHTPPPHTHTAHTLQCLQSTARTMIGRRARLPLLRVQGRWLRDALDPPSTQQSVRLHLKHPSGHARTQAHIVTLAASPEPNPDHTEPSKICVDGDTSRTQDKNGREWREHAQYRSLYTARCSTRGARPCPYCTAGTNRCVPTTTAMTLPRAEAQALTARGGDVK